MKDRATKKANKGHENGGKDTASRIRRNAGKLTIRKALKNLNHKDS